MYDVIVVGGGNAALCAAISARENQSSVLVLEASPFKWRGGNSIHTRNMRISHDAPTEILTGTYLEKEFWNDLYQVTKGETNPELSELIIRQSKTLVGWLEKRGMYFQASISGTLSLSRTNAFFLGGGKTYLNSLYEYAEKIGVKILYEHEVVDVVIEKGKYKNLIVKNQGKEKSFSSLAVVFASGGFESNREWLKEVWGKKADNFLIRGTEYNQGKVLKRLLDQKVKPVGKKNGCHAVAIDGRAPLYNGGIITRLDCIPFGIVVNESGERFYDEGENFWPKRYAIWGRLVAEQPNQIGYVIIDSKSIDLFMPSVFPPVEANSLEELIKKLKLPPKATLTTIKKFNDNVVEKNFNPRELDDCRTRNLKPNKTHWARKINQPPYYGYLLKTGITFTYLGVEITNQAQLKMENGQTSKNMFAAGEMVAGNVLGQGYLAGFGMTLGSVLGIIAGKEASYVK